MSFGKPERWNTPNKKTYEAGSACLVSIGEKEQTSMHVYLDNSATTRQHDSVTEIMVRTMKEDYGNPSSLHRMGLAAEKILKEARGRIAGSLQVLPEEIIFTSGGTEADNLAILGAVGTNSKRGNRIITTAVEHPAVLEPCRGLEDRGYDIVRLPVNPKGVVSPEALEGALTPETLLVTVMHVNNEVGAVQPVREIYQRIKAYNQQHKSRILFHTDGVQSYGKLPLSGEDADMISLSGHKIHGPKGIGALYVKKGISLQPLMAGGGQERGKRSGTENVPAIAGFGVAAEHILLNREEIYRHLESCRRFLAEQLQERIPFAIINGPDEGQCQPGIISVSFPGLKGEVLLHFLEQEGIYVSTGSACSSGKKGQSHVLSAMGLPADRLEGTLRFSFSEYTTREEVAFTMDRLEEITSRMNQLKQSRRR
jgi:cysteine desulfurase